jgi:hypothetical protein
MGRIGGVDELEEFDEFAAAMKEPTITAEAKAWVVNLACGKAMMRAKRSRAGSATSS